MIGFTNLFFFSVFFFLFIYFLFVFFLFFPSPQSTSKLLTAIIFCMDEKQPPAIRHASMQALSESMPFATNNFANPDERNVIMKKICEATQMQGTDEDSTKTRR